MTCSNRTIVGLKHATLWVNDFAQTGSNRTIVGLKRGKVGVTVDDERGSNRTIVGLKPTPHLLPPAQMGRQQSHHCGIETEPL